MHADDIIRRRRETARRQNRVCSLGGLKPSDDMCAMNCRIHSSMSQDASWLMRTPRYTTTGAGRFTQMTAPAGCS